MARHVRKGDLVMITSGSNKGKTGTILRVINGEDANAARVVIKGMNLRTKHLKPTQRSPQGGIVTREASIHISNVSPVTKDGQATRVRFVTKADGSKVRVAARSGEELGVVRGAEAKKHVKGGGSAAKASKPAAKPAAKSGAKKAAAAKA